MISLLRPDPAEGRTMLDQLRHHSYRVEQEFILGSLAFVLLSFGWSVIVRQRQHGRVFAWPLPGRTVGGIFVITLGLIPVHMTIVRTDWAPWTATSWQATLVYGLIAVNSLAVFGRWIRHGFSDAPWDGQTERRKRERRRHWPLR